MHHKFTANEQTWTKLTPLYLTVKNGHVSIVEELLTWGAKTDIADENGNTPLHIAAKQGYIEIVLQLLKGRADINATTSIGETPLFLAAAFGWANIVEVLTESGADINSKCNDFTPLMIAQFLGHLGDNTTDVITFLVSKGAKGLTIPPSKKTASVLCPQMELWCTVHGKQRQYFAHYQHSESDVLWDEKKFTTLYTAVRYGNIDSACYESTYGVLSQIRNRFPILHYAAKHGQAELVSDILCGRWLQLQQVPMCPSIEDINILTPDSNSISPMEHAVQSNHPGVVAVLLNHGIGKNDDLDHFLILAAQSGYTALVELFLSNKQYIPAIVNEALRHAVVRGHFDTVQLLLKTEIRDENTLNNGLWLALHSNQVAIADLLLQNGAKEDTCETIILRPNNSNTVIKGDKHMVRAVLGHYIFVASKKIEPE